MVTRGMRNNNPFNIVRSSSRWLGLSKFKTDPKFCEFDDLNYGLRAGLMLIANYVRYRHLVSVKSIIERFAPPSENDTERYICFVASHIADYIGQSTVVVLHDLRVEVGEKVYFLLCQAICLYESTYCPSLGKLSQIYLDYGIGANKETASSLASEI